MRRFGLRVLMALVGLSLLALYLALAAGSYWVVSSLWFGRPDLETTVLALVGLTLVFGLVSYRFGTAQLLASVDAVELPRGRFPELDRRLDRLTARMDVGTPRILVARLRLPNAMALGTARNGVVVVDRSLFWLLSADEFEALLAHELAHLESHDGLLQTLAYSAAQTVVGLVVVALLPVVLLVSGLAQSVAWIRGRPASWTSTPFGRLLGVVGRGVAVGLFVLTLFVRAHSRRREFAADDRAATVTGKPVALARALRRIERASNPTTQLHTPLYVHGREEDPISRLLSTHPPMDDRVDRLLARVDEAEREGRLIPIR